MSRNSSSTSSDTWPSSSGRSSRGRRSWSWPASSPSAATSMLPGRARRASPARTSATCSGSGWAAQGVKLLDRFPKMKQHFGKGHPAVRALRRDGDLHHAVALRPADHLRGHHRHLADLGVKFLIYEAVTWSSGRCHPRRRLLLRRRRRAGPRPRRSHREVGAAGPGRRRRRRVGVPPGSEGTAGNRRISDAAAGRIGRAARLSLSRAACVRQLQVLSGAVHVEGEHQHRRTERIGFPPLARIGGAFQRPRDRARIALARSPLSKSESVARLGDVFRPAFASHDQWCLKYCTARSCFSAASRLLNVPRFRRLPVFGSCFRE